MRAALIAMFLMSAAPAIAEGEFEYGEAAYDQIDAQFQCTTGKNDQGQSLDEATVNEACSNAERIGKLLADQGYCYDRGIKDWQPCKK